MNAAQWRMNYLAGSVLQIEMDVRNFGTSDLSLRLLFEDPIPGPPSNMAISTIPIVVPAGSEWMHVVFAIASGDLTAMLGSTAGALSNTTILRLFDNPLGPEFPGPPRASLLGVDNITAQVNVVPEPSVLVLTMIGAAVAVRRRLTRHQ